ncbi:MAG: hypothetical protein ACKVT0_18815 [Planctomycetaceae bacterium]
MYELREGERTIGEFSVQFFDPLESTLAELTPGTRQPTVATEVIGYDLDKPLTWLMLLGLIAILVLLFSDWNVLAPRSQAPLGKRESARASASRNV